MKQPIDIYRIYTTQEASKLIGTSDRNLIAEIEKGNLKATNIGKGWKILGENLLIFMGSPSLTYINERKI